MPDCEEMVPGHWIDPELFLSMCREDPSVQSAFSSGDVEELHAAIEKVFDERWLVRLIQNWEERSPQIFQWVEESLDKPRPKQARRRGRGPDPNKRYRFRCKKCGEKCGIHYYSTSTCCSCGGSDIVREETKSPMGVLGRILLEKSK